MMLFSAWKMTKSVVAVLVVVALAAAGLGYYVETRPFSPSVSATPSSAFPSMSTSKPTSTPLPTATYSPTPLITSTPTPISTFPTHTPTTAPSSTLASSVSPLPTSSPSDIPTQQVRDAAIIFIKTSHPETAQFMTNLSWTGGRATPSNIVGAETYIYLSQGWNVTITYPVVPNPIYKVTADYSATGVSIPYRVIWKGTWQNDVINEISYVFAQ